MMPLYYGDQGGFHVEAQARITGFEPGDPTDVLAPGNPYTRFTVFFADTMTPGSTAHCAYRRGYVPSPDQPNAYDLAAGERHMFATCYRPEDLFYKNMLMRVEIVDASNGYAVNEVPFEALPPVDWNPNDPPPTGGGC